MALLLLIPEPICLTDIKTSLLYYRHSSVKVCSSLELLLEPCILLEFGKQG